MVRAARPAVPARATAIPRLPVGRAIDRERRIGGGAIGRRTAPPKPYPAWWLDGAKRVRYTAAVAINPDVQIAPECRVAKRSRSPQASRPISARRTGREAAAQAPTPAESASPAAVAPPTSPPPATPARPTGRIAPLSPVSITTTDYGYVVGELRRIAVLTLVLVVVLVVAWLLLG